MIEDKKLEEELFIDDEVRFHRTLDFQSHKTLAAINFHIIGAGAIGSNVAFYLAKMGGRRITIWDDDKFEEHNLPMQICRIQDIGKNKVDAVADIIKDFEGIKIVGRPERFAGDVPPGSIVIAGVDSMASRKEIWKLVKGEPIGLLIDGRMGLTAMNIYSVDQVESSAVKYYEATLWDDDAVTPIRCTAKATIFTAGTIASLICTIISKIVRSQPVPLEITMEMDALYLKTVDKNGKAILESQPTGEAIWPTKIQP